MAGRKSNVLKSRNDTAPKPKPKRKAGKALNALAIAEHEFPTKAKVRAHRYGEVEDLPKRRRNDDDDDIPDNKRRRTNDDGAADGDYGSDSEGHEWKVGQVDSEDDSDIDSDEALGSSDEERFQDFTFRGSSSKSDHKAGRKSDKPKKSRNRREIDLAEASASDADSDNEEDYDDDDKDDDLGEDAVDLATAWDMNAEDDDDEPAAKTTKKSKKLVSVTKYSDDSTSQSESDASSEDMESDDSDISLSEDEEDEREDGLSKLQDFVSSLKTGSAENTSQQRKVLGQENGVPTEFGLTSTRKINISDILSSVTDSKLKGSLKHLSSSSTTPGTKSSTLGKVTAPLAKRQQDKIDRAAAYEKSKETLNRWIDTVKANREAEHISFPLPDPQEQQPARLGPVEPKTDLESTIKSILVESGLASDEQSAEKQFQAAEELETRNMSLEEVRARNAELRKRRDLLFREEVRSKRIKKIKSKSYRRVHRKEREKMEEVERQAMIDAGIDPDEQERELYDRRRAEARMSTKHKDSKWAKSMKQTGRTMWDEDARSSVIDMARRDEELQRRIEGRNVKAADDEYLGSSSSESSDNDDHDEFDEEDDSEVQARRTLRDLDALDGQDESELSGPHSKLMAMSFMKKAEAGRKQQNDEEIQKLRREINGEDEPAEEEEGGRKKFGVSKPIVKSNLTVSRGKNEFEEGVDSEDEQDISTSEDVIRSSHGGYTQGNAHSKPATVKKSSKEVKLTSTSEQPDQENENPWLVQNTRANRKRHVNNSDEQVNISTDVQAVSEPKDIAGAHSKSGKAKTSKSHISNQGQESDMDSDGENDPVLLTNHDLVKRAFAGDDVVEEFEREKQEVIEEEGDQVIDNTLPGWGSWTGAGISKKQQKRQKKFLTKVEGIKPEQRKDAKLGHVIINEKRVKKNVRYMATQLPHPFENRQQYERSLRQPIGPEWSTSDTFHESTKPRVLIKQGIIKPMQRPLM